ncbi:hypothetical protein [Desulfobacula sp.]
MKDHYIPEGDFPIGLDKNVFMLGNYFFNLFLVVGSQKCALFEVGVSGVVDVIENIKKSPFSDEMLALELFEQNYKDEFTLYTEDNIKNRTSLLVKRAKEVI